MQTISAPHYNAFSRDGQPLQPIANAIPQAVDGAPQEMKEHRRCAACGSSEISLDIASGGLRCAFCDSITKDPTQAQLETDLAESVEGIWLSDGAAAVPDPSAEANIVTLLCPNCGAEVVIDLQDANTTRCQWCHSNLSITQRIANGVLPDYVLPFSMPKDQAINNIQGFLNARKFFANKKFTEELRLDNVMGVYMPYTLVDARIHATYQGEGEIETARHSDDDDTYYDAAVFDVYREFDLVVNDLSLESNSERTEHSKERTDNIITSIMPFDTENCVRFDSRYLVGFASEKRDVSAATQIPAAETQLADIARNTAAEIKRNPIPNPEYQKKGLFGKGEKLLEDKYGYDRGIHWDRQDVQVKSERWNTAYLPVWLYSYFQEDKNLMHYIAVNGRTGETMGSVPTNTQRLTTTSLLVGLASMILAILGYFVLDIDSAFLLLLAGPIFYFCMKSRYRNQGARHAHECETVRKRTNVIATDRYVCERKNLDDSEIRGRNDNDVNG